MPKVTDAHREARRAQIIDAALECFAERGFQRTSMADIIKTSGLSAGAIYLQFESKQQIAVATAQRVVARRLDVLSGRLSETPLPAPGEVVDLVTRHIAEEVRDSRILFQLWAEALFEPEIAELIDAVFTQLTKLLTDYLAAWVSETRDLPADEARGWALGRAPVLLGAFQGHIVQSAMLSGFDPTRYQAAVTALFSGEDELW